MMFSTAGDYVGNYVGNLKLEFGQFGFRDRYLECVRNSCRSPWKLLTSGILSSPGQPPTFDFLQAAALGFRNCAPDEEKRRDADDSVKQKGARRGQHSRQREESEGHHQRPAPEK